MVRGFAVTPATLGTTVFPIPTRGVWVGGAGNIEVVMNGDTVPVTMLGVPVGTMLNISVIQVISALTTATNIIGFY
jgi:hypothetical protein